MPAPVKGLVERLKDGEQVLVAEGYLFEFERRGYLKAGAFIPEVVLDHPELVKQMHEEFVHAGSDVVVAFTYYGHREKLRYIGREADLEKMNRNALRIARQVANETGTLMAGDICNTTVYVTEDTKSHDEVREMFREQVEWACEEGADFIIAETIGHLGEAKLALEAIKQYGKGVPAVINMVFHKELVTYEGIPYCTAIKELEDMGADVVGVNCSRGPQTIIPLIRELRNVCKGPIAALPVPYRTYDVYPTFQSLPDDSGSRAFPTELDAWQCTRKQIHEFAVDCAEIGVQFVGLCCGNCSHMFRTLAEGLGRTTAASRFSPDMSQHYMFGSHPRNRDENMAMKEKI